jgi:hypothetical protein
MSANIVIGIACGLASVMLTVSALTDVIKWAFREGYDRGRADADKAFIEAGRQVDQARQEIWREHS